jgi:hypothetical protein
MFNFNDPKPINPRDKLPPFRIFSVSYSNPLVLNKTLNRDFTVIQV